MIDSYIKIPDNVGTSFEIVGGNIILGTPQSTYVGLTANDVGHYIPYFIKNLLVDGSTEWEVGIGKVLNTTAVERVEISASSNNNNLVVFSFGGTKTFFVYPNQYSADLGYNNLIKSSGIFNVDPVRSTYIVDLSSSAASGLLPSASGNRGIIIDFKAYNRNNNNLTIKAQNSDLIDGSNTLLINYDDAYTTLVSDGSSWTQLKDNKQISVDPNLLGTPQGNTGSIQYKSGEGVFGGSSIYFDNSTGSLSFGENADITISPSGDTIFNNGRQNINFIVKGSGNRNLFFDASGRLGLNLPSGSVPQNLLHLVGYSCDTNVKIENRGSCTTPKLVLYHKPSTLLSNDSEISSIHLSAKSSSGSETEYAKIKAIAASTDSVSPSGAMVVSVNNGGTPLEALYIHPSNLALRNKDRELSITSSGVVTDRLVATSGLSITYLNGNNKILAVNNQQIIDSGYSLDDLASIQQKSSLSGCVFTGDISAPRIFSNSGLNPAIIDLNNQNISGTWTLNDKPILSIDTNEISNENYILTHTGSGVTWKEFNSDNFVWSGQDISWKKYPNRDCVVQNSGYLIVIPNSDLDNEFISNDTIRIDISGTSYYRTITQISENNGYTNITITDPVPVSSSAKVVSISRGGYLELSLDGSGAPTESPQTIISCRPQLDTVFNTYQHDINFKIYGKSTIPALHIQSSGINSYDSTVPVVINGSTPKTVNQINAYNKYASLSVNGYLYTDYIQIGSGTVPSGYMLFSTSNNIAQWQPTTTISDLDGGIITFSGVSL